MNKQKLAAYALVLLAIALSWRMLDEIDRSHEDVFIYDPTESSGLITSNEGYFRIEKEQSDHNFTITYLPPHGFNEFYLVLLLLAWFPYTIWFAPKKNKQRETEIELNSRIEWVQKHRLYSRYIAENEERQYIYKEETVPKFIDWLLKIEAQEAEQNQSGDGQ
jgi:4-amino-4-deoxy-L-arabinose transferase-like glycosyltransferase